MSRLRSRRPFVAEAARLASLTQTEQQTWEQSWIEGVPPGHDVVTNPTCPQPGFTLPRRQFVTLNRLRCGQARCAESLYRWGVIDITCLPLRREPPDHKAHCWRLPTHCIPWRPTTSTRSESRRSGMVIKTVYETVRVFQTNNNITSLVIGRPYAYTTMILLDNETDHAAAPAALRLPALRPLRLLC